MSQRNVTVAAGVSGTGKSLFGRRLLLNGQYAARFLFDAEFSERDRTRTEFSDWLGLPPARTEYELALGLCNGWVCFDPHHHFSGRLDAAVKFFCEWAYAMSAKLPGEKIIAIPEVWRYCRPQGIPQELANIVQSGRRVGLHLLVDTQEPNRLNSSIINGVSEFVAFKLQSPLALDVAENFGLDRIEVKALKTFEFISRDLDGGGERRGKIAL